MGFKGQICIWEGFSFLSPQTSCNGSLFSFPRALSLHPDFGTGHFCFRTKSSHGIWDYSSIKAAGTAPDGGTYIPILILSLFKPSPLFIAGICFFSVGFQIWIYMMFFNAERSERIWILLLSFLFTESCSQIFMSRITNVHAMLAQRVTPAEHTARRVKRNRKRTTHGLLSLIFLTSIRCCFLGSTPKRRWERGTGRLSLC